MLARALLVSTLVMSGCAGTASNSTDTRTAITAPGPSFVSGETGSSVFLTRSGEEAAAAVSSPTGFNVREDDEPTSSTATSGSVDDIGSPPRRIEIPVLGVDAEIIDLGLLADGSLETPTDFAEAGWWAGGATADQAGPTVIVGHVDSFEGPAVFFELSALSAGDHVVVTDAHGGSHRFRVTEVELYDKTDFPTDRVYGDTDEPTLRLVTCGGDFDSRERSYEANWVVFAEAV